MDDIDPRNHPRIRSDGVIPEIHESGLLSTSFALMN